MKITRISTTKKGRLALFFDDEFLFSVDDETLVKFKIEEGSSIQAEELSLIKQASDYQKAKNQALRYLSLRAYGEEELYKKICLKYDEPTSAKAVAIMREIGLLNDEEFAFEKAKGMAMRKKSSSEIHRKLVSLGIDKELAAAAVAAAGVDNILLAANLIETKYEQKLLNGEEEKVKAALARRGFSYTDIKAAIQKVRLGLQEQ